MEEVDPLGVELKRLKVFYRYQEYLLHNALEEVETNLSSFTDKRPGQMPDWSVEAFEAYFTKPFLGNPMFNRSGLKQVISDFRLKGNDVNMTDDAAKEAWYEYCALHKRERGIIKLIIQLNREKGAAVLGRYGQALVKWGKEKWKGEEPTED